jgi:hypothetical protein
VWPLIFNVEAGMFMGLYILKKFGLADTQLELYKLFLMSLTVTGKLVPGITAKLVETPVFKLVKTKAKTSLKAHWYSPYSLEANKKSKLKLFETGTKSNSKKATSVIMED